MARSTQEAAKLIQASGRTIYDEIPRSDPCFLSHDEVEALLAAGLRGLSLAYPIRTRAKVAKAEVCKALGYPVPPSFKKTQPRFPGQDLDIYVQKANNLQIWNEEVSPERRYALIRVNARDEVVAVRVLSGEAIANLDSTGTLTSKFQAKRIEGSAGSKLVSPKDTDVFRAALSPVDVLEDARLANMSPVEPPMPGAVLSVEGLWRRLRGLVGQVIEDPGLDQERNRGAALHQAICAALMMPYRDEGQFPDVRSQALEVKLQTSPTVDLGLVSPDSTAAVEGIGGGLRHCDMRYAVCYGEKPSADEVEVTGVVVTTGAEFFTEFRKFGGLVQNRKLQIPLPANLFTETE